ncbi:exopolysaccharide production repressor protein [Phyllobacterium zundukense]|nr:exopolysaccharide production repressor protein [Phyllobacterium zundukense]ATU92284.1 hypothetical protein BLM14_12040 [Phyllobacterium zundukense]
MRFPRFLIGLLAALLVFGVTTYLITNNFWLTLGQTLICAFLIQLGYFAVILWLVRRRKSLLSDEGHPDDAGFSKERRSILASRLRQTR